MIVLSSFITYSNFAAYNPSDFKDPQMVNLNIQLKYEEVTFSDKLAQTKEEKAKQQQQYEYKF